MKLLYLSNNLIVKIANFPYVFKNKITSILSYTLFIPMVTFLGLGGCSSSTLPTAPQTITSSDPSHQKLDPREIAKTRTAIAAEFIRDHKLDDAKRQLDQALKADPKSPAPYDMMGVLLQEEGSPNNLAKAESYFKKALSLDADFTQANNNYGVYLYRMKRYNEAIAQLQIAGSTLGYDGRASALENLGLTYLKVNNKTLATQTFLKALDANRQSIIARSELIDMLLADGRNTEAKELYDDLVILIGESNLDPRTLVQGIRIAKANTDTALVENLSQQVFQRFPLSPEAKQVRTWLSTPTATWK